MKESFPKIVVEGPVGVYEVLLAGPVPALVAFQASNHLTIVGDRWGLERLARLADLVRERPDTAVHLSLRDNPVPARWAASVVEPGPLDLLLATSPIGMTAKVWDAVRARPSSARRRVALPELDDTLDGARERLEFRQKDRTMDRIVGSGALILSGENVAFRALAGAAAYVARVGPGWIAPPAYAVDWTLRAGELPVRIDYDDASREAL